MKFAIILCAILMVQYLLSFIQIKHYKKNIDKIVRNYKGEDGFFLFSGMERGKFRPGAIAILVVDSDFIIHECHVLSGLSILTKFKAANQYKGKHVGVVLDEVHTGSLLASKKRVPAYRKALFKAGENALLAISKNKISMEA